MIPLTLILIRWLLSSNQLWFAGKFRNKTSMIFPTFPIDFPHLDAHLVRGFPIPRVMLWVVESVWSLGQVTGQRFKSALKLGFRAAYWEPSCAVHHRLHIESYIYIHTYYIIYIYTYIYYIYIWHRHSMHTHMCICVLCVSARLCICVPSCDRLTHKSQRWLAGSHPKFDRKIYWCTLFQNFPMPGLTTGG